MPVLIIKNGIAVFKDAVLTESKTVLRNYVDRGTTTNNAFSVEVSSLPRYFVLSGWKYENGKLSPLPDYEAEKMPTARKDACAVVDTYTSNAVLAGFDYEIDPGTGTPEKLRFSYDSYDQQNFTDTASVATMVVSGVEGLPSSVTWNAYRVTVTRAQTSRIRLRDEEMEGAELTETKELVRLTLTPQTFLELYTKGALVHKATQMEIGGQRKAAINAATTFAEIEELMKGWGLEW